MILKIRELLEIDRKNISKLCVFSIQMFVDWSIWMKNFYSPQQPSNEDKNDRT